MSSPPLLAMIEAGLKHDDEAFIAATETMCKWLDETGDIGTAAMMRAELIKGMKKKRPHRSAPLMPTEIFPRKTR